MYSPPGLHRPGHSLHLPTNVWGAQDHESPGGKNVKTFVTVVSYVILEAPRHVMPPEREGQNWKVGVCW